MYVNIKILAAFPWFQALNVLVTLSLTIRRQQWRCRRTSGALHRKGLGSPSPASFLILPARPQVSQHPDASKASLALMSATRIPWFRLQGRAGRDTGIGLDMYVVFNYTPLAVCCPRWWRWKATEQASQDLGWQRCGCCWWAAGASSHTHCSGGVQSLPGWWTRFTAVASGKGNTQHEDIILATYPLFLWYFLKFSNQ